MSAYALENDLFLINNIIKYI